MSNFEPLVLGSWIHSVMDKSSCSVGGLGFSFLGFRSLSFGLISRLHDVAVMACGLSVRPPGQQQRIGKQLLV